jgi:hypothetical protein
MNLRPPAGNDESGGPALPFGTGCKLWNSRFTRPNACRMLA